MLRYLRLLGVQLRASATVAMQYRVDFLVQGALALFWTTWSLVPVLVVFGNRRAVAGWTFEEALVVIGWFMVMKGILEGAVNPSLAAVVEHIRKGTLDFVLLKPADAQFLVSTQKFAPWRIIDVVSGVVIFAVAFRLDSATSLFEIWMGLFGILSGYLVPLELFPPWVQGLARALPFRSMLGFPVELVIGLLPREQALAELLVQWGWIALLLVAVRAAWRSGLRHFAAFGG